jgi:hypothetical protein
MSSLWMPGYFALEPLSAFVHFLPLISACGEDSMKTNRPMRSRESPQMEAVRDALGAIAVGKPAVFWLYWDDEGMWRVRREGDLDEHQFTDREDACAFLRASAARCQAYRLLMAGNDGRFGEEVLNWPEPRPFVRWHG